MCDSGGLGKGLFPARCFSTVLRDKTDNAIKNARKVEKHHLDLGQALDNENCNPYTAAYKVVEELMKRNN